MKSTKKGYPIQWSNPDSIFMNALLNSKCAWTYNWNVSINEKMLNIINSRDINYCPCVWGKGFDIKKGTKLKTRPRFILGYNEPDQKKQADMSIDMIIDKWAALAEEIPSDIMLVAPAVSDGMFKYRGELYDALRHNGLRFDAIGLHYYRTDIESFPRNDIPKLSDRYGKPCVVSEYGYMDWGNPQRLKFISEQEKKAITSKVINISHYFESSSDVSGYCIYPSYSASEYHGDVYNSFNMLENNRLTDLYKEYSQI